MDQETSKKTLKYILILLVVLLFCWGGYTLYRALPFHIIKTNPSSEKMTVITPFFNVYFNKPLSSNISVTSTPNIISSYHVTGKVIDIDISVPLDQNQTYTISVENISDTSGAHLNNKEFVFKPVFVNSNNLPKDQSQALLNAQVQYNQNAAANELEGLLPFTEPNLQYKISYITKKGAQGNYPVFQITSQSTQNQQAALDWITAQGYDPTKLDIQYITAQP